MEAIVQPISDEATCGEYLKGNKTLYRSLRNSYNQAQSSYRQLMESPDAASDDDLVEQNIENWQSLGKVCEACLAESAKDVEVFGWYISAQLFGAHPLQALQGAFADYASVIEQYWDDLHPKPPVEKLKSDDDAGRDREWAELKIKPMWQLAGESEGAGILAMPLLNLPLIGDINYTQFYSAERAGSLETLKDQAVSYFSAERETITERINALGAIETEVKRIEAAVAERCTSAGARAISFKFLLKLVGDLINACKFLLGDSYARWPLDPAPVAAPQVEEVAAVTVETAAPMVPEESAQSVQTAVAVAPAAQLPPSGEPVNRDQAFAQLREIAQYFQRTEPHSPVHMLLERAIRWGYLPLPELLAEMVGDNAQVMGRINQMAGLESVEKTPLPTAATVTAQAAPAVPVAQPSAPSVEEPKEAASESEQTSSSSIKSFQW
ncbi:MAG: ImpA family type VI secretion system protein [Pseudomonadales bacterium]